ncbi:MAG: hypothetical protein R3350_07260 [Saprospiraceae bacterium]|nr:hypothetical protein [Saprospiraceae bacterium]
MSREVFNNAFRFFGLWLLQIVVLRQIAFDWGGFNHLSIMVYPLFVMLLPLRTPRSLVLLLAFAMGLMVDIAYNSPGVHASASVFMAFVRPVILYQLEPRGGYNINFSPARQRLGRAWFFRYAGLMLIVHHFFYFSVEAFTFVYIADILLKTGVSFVGSMLFIAILMLIFNPLN